MYNNKLAVAIKSAGKVLREVGDSVYLPFGSEYSIFVKNLNSVRALVSISVDGQDVGDGTSFVVNPNDAIDIERFIKKGNLKEGNRLKFIERTANIEKHRGVGIEDGLIRIEFKFEHIPVPIYYDTYNMWRSVNSSPHIGNIANPHIGNEVTYTSNVTASVGTSELTKSFSAQNDVGITVPGSVSDQQFKETSWFPTESESHVIVLKMLGETETSTVTAPVTVKTKPKCTTCGRTNKATAKFCTECGTSLTLV